MVDSCVSNGAKVNKKNEMTKKMYDFSDYFLSLPKFYYPFKA